MSEGTLGSTIRLDAARVFRSFPRNIRRSRTGAPRAILTRHESAMIEQPIFSDKLPLQSPPKKEGKTDPFLQIGAQRFCLASLVTIVNPAEGQRHVPDH